MLDEAESHISPAALQIMASPSSFTYYCPPSSSSVWPETLYSLRPEHARERLQDDSVETVTSREQVRWRDWARRPRGSFWEREFRPRRRAMQSLPGDYDSHSAPRRPRRAPGAGAGVSERSLLRGHIGRGRRQAALGGGAGPRLRSASGSGRVVFGAWSPRRPGRMRPPLHSVGTAGASGTDSVLPLGLRGRGDAGTRPDCSCAISQAA